MTEGQRRLGGMDMEDVEKICEGTVAMFDMAYKAQPKELNEPQTLRWNITKTDGPPKDDRPVRAIAEGVERNAVFDDNHCWWGYPDWDDISVPLCWRALTKTERIAHILEMAKDIGHHSAVAQAYAI